MPDQYKVVRYSEAIPIQSGTFKPTAGLEDLESVVCTLYDAEGNVAGNVSAAAATGFTVSASVAPYAWYNLGPKAGALPVPETFQDVYTLWFLATDVNLQKRESVVGVVVRRDGT